MSSYSRRTRRAMERQAIAYAHALGCRCEPSASWHPIVVDGRAGETIRLGHALDCPRLADLRALVGETPLPFDLLTARLRPEEQR